MGYTHYWTYKPENAEDSYSLKRGFARAAERIVGYLNFLRENRGIVVAGPLGDGEPIINDISIRFNGDGGTGLDHETFSLDFFEAGGGFAFCKTARKPYDTLVCLSLIALFEEIGDRSVFGYSSDGDDEDWAEARDVYRVLHEKEPPKIGDCASRR